MNRDLCECSLKKASDVSVKVQDDENVVKRTERKSMIHKIYSCVYRERKATVSFVNRTHARARVCICYSAHPLNVETARLERL